MEILKYIRENVRGGPVTTIIGVIIVLAGIASIFVLKLKWEEVTAIIAIGVILIGLPDPKMKIGKLKFLLFLVSLGLLSSCVTQKRCAQKFGDRTEIIKTDSFFRDRLVEVRDTIIKTKLDTVTALIESPCDSNGHLKDFYIEKKGNNNAVIIIESRGDSIYAEARCDSLEMIITKQRETIVQLAFQSTGTKETTTLTVKRVPRYAKWYMIPLYGLIGIVIGYMKPHRLLRLIKPI